MSNEPSSPVDCGILVQSPGNACYAAPMKLSIAGLALLLGLLPAAGQVASNQPAAAPVKILKRNEWGAKPPVAEMKRHELTRITIHHTATLQKPDRSLTDKLKAL